MADQPVAISILGVSKGTHASRSLLVNFLLRPAKALRQKTINASSVRQEQEPLQGGSRNPSANFTLQLTCSETEERNTAARYKLRVSFTILP